MKHLKSKMQLDVVIANTIFLPGLQRLCANKNCSYSKDDIESVGRVYLFQFTLTSSPQPLATITGHKTFMKLGSSLTVGNPYNNSYVNKDGDMLAVSAMTLSKFLQLNSKFPVSDQHLISLINYLRLSIHCLIDR